MPEITITEIEEFEPERVDGVGKGANGFPILMLKSVDSESASLANVTNDAAKADRKDCPTCDGSGSIMGGNRECPDCRGFGKAPMVGESVKQYAEAAKAGVAASSANDPYPAGECPTCEGHGAIADGTVDGKPCPDCGGTGIAENMVNPVELNAVAGDPGSITVGDPMGRERIDKAEAMECPCGATVPGDAKFCPGCGEEITMTKGHHDIDGFRPAPYSPDDDDNVQCPECSRMNDMDSFYCSQCGHRLAGNNEVVVDGKPVGDEDEDEAEDTMKAMVDRHFNKAKEDMATIMRHDKGHDDWHRGYGDEPCTSEADCNAKAAKYEEMDAAKAVIVSTDGTMASGPNPMDADDISDGSFNIDSITMPTPGSPEWEAVDAATATAAAQALMQAAEFIRQFAQREMQEVAAGEGNDLYDAGFASQALSGVSAALGIMAQLAFHEGMEAQKSLDDEDVQKAGRRLSTKSVAALTAARDHLNVLLGDDDPSSVKDDKGSKSDNDGVAKYMKSADVALLAEEIDSMTTDELQKVLDARDERLVSLLADAMKSEVLDNEDAPVVDAQDEAAKAADDMKADDADMKTDDAEDEDKADDDEDAAKAADLEPTADEIEAREQIRAAKKALKAAKRAEKEAAETAAMQKAIAEGVAEAAEAVRALQDRLSTVEKMAAPSNIVRTRPQEALTKSVERDELELRLAHLERVARETPDTDIRKASREEAAEIRTKITSLSA